METQQVTLVTRAHDGKVTVHADIPVSGDADTYVVTIEVAPQTSATAPASPTLDELYGALADTPLPEIDDDPLPESRDEV